MYNNVDLFETSNSKTNSQKICLREIRKSTRHVRFIQYCLERNKGRLETVSLDVVCIPTSPWAGT